MNPRNRKKPKKGRPCKVKEDYSAIRSTLERFFGWLKSYRRIIIRYEHIASMYIAFVKLACIMILFKGFCNKF